MFRPVRARRSVLYVPASNPKALAKLPSLDADAVIIDLEDAVAPSAKEAAREALRGLKAVRPRGELIVRINALSSEWGAEDFLASRALKPDAILLPKVETPRHVLDAMDALNETDAPPEIRLWAMIETPKAVLNLAMIAELGAVGAARLDCFVTGTNDLAKDTGVASRAFMLPWLMQIILAARAAGLDVIDGVYNSFADQAGFAAECTEAAAMGFDGKSLIHPAQIAAANAAFSPSAEALAEAHALVAAFALPENAGKGVIALDGRMAERLHLARAERLLARGPLSPLAGEMADRPEGV